MLHGFHRHRCKGKGFCDYKMERNTFLSAAALDATAALRFLDSSVLFLFFPTSLSSLVCGVQIFSVDKPGRNAVKR